MLSAASIKFRANKIGGSDIAAILGKQKPGWRGAASVAQRILGQSKEQTFYKAEFDFGNRWESEVAELFAETCPEFVVLDLKTAYDAGYLFDLGFKGRIVELEDGTLTVLDPDYDFIVLNVDYLLICRDGSGWGVLEAKTASEYVRSDWGVTGTDLIPTWYEDQPRFYADRLGADLCFVATLIGQRDFRVYPLDCYEPEQAGDILMEVVSWYEEHIVRKQPVPPSFGEAPALSVVRERLEANAELMGTIRKHRQLWEQLKGLQLEYDKLDNVIRSACAEYNELSYNGKVLFSNSESEGMKFDSKQLEREDPKTYAKYLKPSHTKRFLKASGYDDLSIAGQIHSPRMAV